MEVNLYDFDGTIYDGDSSVDFYLFCLKKKFIIIRYALIFLVYAFLYKLKIVTKEKMKEKFFGFLNSFNNIDEIVLEFWNKKYNKIKLFYKEKKHNKDIIISASPYFLLYPICNKLKVKKLIASDVDKKTGKFHSLNCHGKEKVLRLKKEFKNKVIINEVYSDSYKDIPILELGEKSYLVKHNKIMQLSKEDLKRNKKI